MPRRAVRHIGSSASAYIAIHPEGGTAMDKSKRKPQEKATDHKLADAALSDQQLDAVAGGLVFKFDVVAVKTISWVGTPYDNMKGGKCTK